jgi:thioester reductase-like protein
MSDTTLVTGFPSYLVQCLVRRLFETDPGERVFLLCPGRFQVAAEVFVQELPRQARERVEVLIGDPGDMDLGLSGADYRRLCGSLTAIQHLAAGAQEPPPSSRSHPPGGRRAQSGRRESPILAGARHIVELSCDAGRLRRLCYLSATSVAGTRSGVVLEDELWVGQRFLDPRDEALMTAEGVIRSAMEQRRLPATILRPGPLVGDSRTGEIDAFVGPYALIQLVLRAKLDVAELLPVLGWGAAPVNLCPVDFATEAAVLLSRDPRAQGLTCHLVDPNPLSVRAVAELAARHADRSARPGGYSMPPRLASLTRAVLRAPGLERLARVPLAALEETLGLLVYYNCQNTLRLLRGTGVECPPAAAYVDKLVAFLRQAQVEERAREEDEADPLD